MTRRREVDPAAESLHALTDAAQRRAPARPVAEPRTLDLTPEPAGHFRILARLADGATPTNYVSVELRRMADIYERCGVTWDALNAFLNASKAARQ